MKLPWHICTQWHVWVALASVTTGLASLCVHGGDAFGACTWGFTTGVSVHMAIVMYFGARADKAPKEPRVLVSIVRRKATVRSLMVSVFVKRRCGCCVGELRFESEARATTALADAGIGGDQTVTDDTGTEYTGLDTFYGYTLSMAEQRERGIDYLFNTLVQRRGGRQRES